MNDKCKEKDKIELKDKVLDQISNEEVEPNMESVMEFIIPMDIDDIIGLKHDTKSFNNGISDMSFASGQITSLVNIGLSIEQAVDVVVNKMNINHNLELAKLNNKASIEIARITEVKQNANMI